MTKPKSFGHTDLKTARLDGTWLPRGFFGEESFVCSNGHIIIHHPNVRRRDKAAPQNNGRANYTVNPADGTVTVRCPIDAEVLMTYTPNPLFKNFTGEFTNVEDGKEIQ